MHTPRYILFLLSLSCTLSAQDEPPPVKRKVNIRDLYAGTGAVMQSVKHVTTKEFSMLAPGSVLIPLSNGFDRSDGLNLTVNSLLDVNVGLNFANKQMNYYKPNPQVRIGLAFYSQASLESFYFREDRKAYDTIINLQSGDTAYLDSVISKSLAMEYGSDQLRLDASVIFRTERTRRFSLYTGVGVTAGLTLSAYTNIHYLERRWVVERNKPGVFGDTTAQSDRHERFVNRKGAGVSIYIPMGIDFRIGKRREGLRRLHLFSESRPFIGTTFIPELSRHNTFGLHYWFGIRYTMD
jgi:hypothetical protein